MIKRDEALVDIETDKVGLEVPAQLPVTTAPTGEQLAIIAALDPHNQRAYQIKGNPPGNGVVGDD